LIEEARFSPKRENSRGRATERARHDLSNQNDSLDLEFSLLGEGFSPKRENPSLLSKTEAWNAGVVP
jgi:hypothetical protein